MKYSENYHLYLPEGSDFVSPEQFNNNFKTLDAKLKTVETQAGQVAGHTHNIADLSGSIPAERVTAGAFPGTSYKFPEGAELRLGTDVQYVTIQKSGTKFELLGHWSATSKHGIRILLNTANEKSSLALVWDHGSGEKIYYLYGDHNKPTIAGGYTGDGTTDRNIALGTGNKPTFMIIWAADTRITSGAKLIAFLFRDGGTTKGYMLNSNGGSSIVWTDAGVSLSGQYIEIMGSAAANLVNANGVAYHYWGDRS